jgi:hypothetical protein
MVGPNARATAGALLAVALAGLAAVAISQRKSGNGRKRAGAD